MAPDVDKSLLDRLQALRGATQRQPPTEVKVDLIERKGTPTREDALTARLKSLRDGASSSAPSPVARPSAPRTDGTGRGTPNSVKKRPESAAVSAPKKDVGSCPPLKKEVVVEEEEEEEEEEGYEDDVDLAFQTDDQTLQELLEDVSPEDGVFPAPRQEPADEDVRRLLEELATSIPKDDAETNNVHPAGRHAGGDDHEASGHPDPDEDSDGEDMKRDVDDVIARFRDEIELEKTLSDEPPSPSPSPPPDQTNNKATAGNHQDEDDQEGNTTSASTLPSLPAVPDSLSSIPSPDPAAASAASDIDSLTTRLSALRASPAPNSALDLPDVPTSKPANAPRRLETTTAYDDDDVDSWCTVCLEDATLRCTGCVDERTGCGEPYCARCWREMHVGPSAGYEERGHKAVVFNKKEGKKKEKKKKVAIGAS
ncbi:hypothetical protein N3K66_005348 [Trichothecium roseum]|uniref:Uncharacterized protein n=1 Tax=Trichothecium roseum TaxID=47278 RepID=A0ACC0UZB1_9HYPO|nr:hypothetical protein N3K66_005348 [Trichothecium roseum]